MEPDPEPEETDDAGTPFNDGSFFDDGTGFD